MDRTRVWLGPAGWTIAVFGALALLLGAAGLLAPQIVLALLGFATVPAAERAAFDYTTVFLMASSMASVNMGVYYLLAAFTGMRQFFGWTVPFRILTFCVFSLAVVSGYAPPRFFWRGCLGTGGRAGHRCGAGLRAAARSAAADLIGAGVIGSAHPHA